MKITINIFCTKTSYKDHLKSCFKIKKKIVNVVIEQKNNCRKTKLDIFHDCSYFNIRDY